MADTTTQRINMVDSQVRPSDVTDRRIPRAMLDVPREVFVPTAQRSLAYRDATLAKVREKAITGGTEGIVYINGDPCYAKR